MSFTYFFVFVFLYLFIHNDEIQAVISNNWNLITFCALWCLHLGSCSGTSRYKTLMVLNQVIIHVNKTEDKYFFALLFAVFNPIQMKLLLLTDINTFLTSYQNPIKKRRKKRIQAMVLTFLRPSDVS